MYLQNPIGAGSVGTAQLADGAVTEAKTDFDTTPLSIAGGGTGTATPKLTAGSGIVITGSWPDNTIAT